MKHARVKSSNVHSIAHEGDVLEVRFNCSTCHGEGHVSVDGFTGPEARECTACGGVGHKGTYRYAGVPRSMHDHIAGSESPGKAFNSLIRGNPQFKAEKL